MVLPVYRMIPPSSSFFISLWSDGRDTFKIIAHLDMESGIFTVVFPVCLICISIQKAAFCAIPL